MGFSLLINQKTVLLAVIELHYRKGSFGSLRLFSLFFNWRDRGVWWPFLYWWGAFTFCWVASSSQIFQALISFVFLNLLRCCCTSRGAISDCKYAFLPIFRGLISNFLLVCLILSPFNPICSFLELLECQFAGPFLFRFGFQLRVVSFWLWLAHFCQSVGVIRSWWFFNLHWFFNLWFFFFRKHR